MEQRRENSSLLPVSTTRFIHPSQVVAWLRATERHAPLGRNPRSNKANKSDIYSANNQLGTLVPSNFPVSAYTNISQMGSGAE
jgi:hypothetical protein